MKTKLTPPEKLDAIISEYTVAEHNQHVLTGTGGNIEYYLFLDTKETVFSDNIDTLSITDKQLICNPVFIEQTPAKDVRKLLDEKIVAAIKETGFVAPIRWVADSDGSKKLITDVDLEKNTATTQIVLAMRQCAELTSLVDTGKLTDEFCAAFAKRCSSYKLPVVLYAMRTQIGIERLVKHTLDEHRILGPFMDKINKYGFIELNQ